LAALGLVSSGKGELARLPFDLAQKVRGALLGKALCVAGFPRAREVSF